MSLTRPFRWCCIAFALLSLLTASESTRAASIQVNWSATDFELGPVGGTIVTVDSSLIFAPISLLGQSLTMDWPEFGIVSALCAGPDCEMAFVFTDTNLASLAGTLVDANPFDGGGPVPGQEGVTFFADVSGRLLASDNFLYTSAFLVPVSYSFVVVPEPGTALLVCLGIGLLALRHRGP